MQQEVADRRGEAATWDTLGYAHHHLGQHQEAIRCYRHALELFLKTGDRYYQADTLVHLGDTQHATGDSDSARRTWEQALEILDDLGHASAEVVRTKVLTSTTDLALTGLDPPCPEAGLATRSCPPSPRR
ncbi:MAG: tetratricopeptide repeat protein [Micromonosporaceae bacterium]